MFIHWESKLETGQPLIDAEHRLLLMLFRKLDIGIKTHQSEATLKQVILEVKKFVEFHFTSEENLMRETGYPAFEAHQKLHAELLEELNVLVARVVSRREFPDELLAFLNHWLIDHIAKHDQALARFVSASASRPVAEMSYAEFLLPLTPGADRER
jgi:hemerythrin-like metal-binding protein